MSDNWEEAKAGCLGVVFIVIGVSTLAVGSILLPVLFIATGFFLWWLIVNNHRSSGAREPSESASPPSSIDSASFGPEPDRRAMPEAPPPLSPPKSFPETAQEIESRIRQQYNEQMEAAKREWAEVSRQQGARVQAEVSAEANKRLRMAEDRLRSEYGQRLKDERAKMQMAAEAAFERSRVEWESERRRQAQEPSNRKKTRADHENILGIIRPYTRVELTRKYREKAAKCHPDKVMHLDAELQKVAERLMKDLNAARDFLADHCSP